MDYHDRIINITVDEIDAFERWLQQPIFKRVNAEIIDAACTAANAIARAVYVQIEDEDIKF